MQGQKNPNAQTCIKLAAYYTVLDHVTENNVTNHNEPIMHSGADHDAINYDGDSDFARAIRGKSQEEVFAVIDELMTTLQVMHPRLYTGVMCRL